MRDPPIRYHPIRISYFLPSPSRDSFPFWCLDLLMDSSFAPLFAYFSIGAGCILVAAVMNRMRNKRNRLDEYADLPQTVKEPLQGENAQRKNSVDSDGEDALFNVPLNAPGHEYLTVRISDGDDIPGIYSALPTASPTHKVSSRSSKHA